MWDTIDARKSISSINSVIIKTMQSPTLHSPTHCSTPPPLPNHQHLLCPKLTRPTVFFPNGSSMPFSHTRIRLMLESRFLAPTVFFPNLENSRWGWKPQFPPPSLNGQLHQTSQLRTHHTKDDSLVFTSNHYCRIQLESLQTPQKPRTQPTATQLPAQTHFSNSSRKRTTTPNISKTETNSLHHLRNHQSKTQLKSHELKINLKRHQKSNPNREHNPESQQPSPPQNHHQTTSNTQPQINPNQLPESRKWKPITYLDFPPEKPKNRTSNSSD
jgi:hypothetical protein